MKRWVFVAGCLAAVGGCGGSGSSGPTTPSAPPPVSGATIVITAAGAVSPNRVQIAVGQAVTFVNQDTRPHEPSSDPHPEHTGCPPMAQVGFLRSGQQRATGAFTTARTCTFHDHLSSADSLRGTIVIQ